MATQSSLLDQSVLLAKDLLKTFAESGDFTNILTQAFGSSFDQAEAEAIRQQWLSGDFSDSPLIELLSGSILGRANGAYAASNNTIYLSQDYLEANANQPQTIAGVLLEEIGHYVDSRINSFDAAGDEGEIFSALVQGKILSKQQLQLLRTEDDSASITLSGQSLGIEQSGNPIQYFYYDDPDRPLPLIDVNKDTIVVIHGWRGDFSSNLGTLAQQLAEQNPASQVIALDWSQTANQITPRLAAGYIKAVAEWVVSKLGLASGKITLIGHSLGSYLAAEISSQLGAVGELVALDPAYRASTYDIDNRDSDSDHVSNFRNDTNQSLALVAADLYGTGAAGDTYQAGTADKSFIVKFSDLNYGLVSAGDAHSGVIDIYNDLESRNLDISSGIIFANIPHDRFNNEGNPVAPGAGGLHEGAINAIDVDSTSERLWKIEDIVGEGWRVYIVDSDANKPTGGDGIDTVSSSVTLTLENTNIENLALAHTFNGTDILNIDGTGNSLNNILIGNIGNNSLDGKEGDDTLNGGDGNDTLEGGTGNDRLNGGNGDDTYIVGVVSDTVTEATGAGTDTVQSAVSWALGANLENLTLTGTGAIDGTGNSLNNTITGNAANNTLNGGDGNDILDGGAGNDYLNGGFGDDTLNSGDGDDTVNTGLGVRDYADGGEGDDLLIVDYSVGDTGSGLQFNPSRQTYGETNYALRHTVDSDVLDYLRFYNFERYNVTGTSKNDIINGAAGNDILIGGAGDDFISAGGSTDIDILDGGAGTDRLIADLSNRTQSIVFDTTVNQQMMLADGTQITNFEQFNVLTGSGNDQITLHDRANDYAFTNAGNDTVNLGLGVDDFADGGEGDDLLIVDYSVGDTGSGLQFNPSRQAYGETNYALRHTVDSAVLDYLRFYNFERYNVTGTSKNDIINGAAGNDILIGGAGDDFISAGGSTDIDILDGGAGTDRLIADLSNRTQSIVFDTTVNQQMMLADGTQITNFEQFNVLTGSGNDQITLHDRANDYAFTNAGNDTVNLGLGVDDFADGGEGDDLLIVDYSVGDTGSGLQFNPSRQAYGETNYALRHTVDSAVLDYLRFYNFERYNVTGTSKNDTIYGAAGNDILIGGAGDDFISAGGSTDIDILDGGAGTDRLIADLSNRTQSIVFDTTVNQQMMLADGTQISNFEQFYVYTGSGNDQITLHDRANDSVGTSAGNDTVNLGLGVDDFADGGEGDDLLIVDYSVGDTGSGLQFNPSLEAYGYSNNAKRYTADGSAVLDYLRFTGFERYNVTGTSKNDTIYGGTGNDVFKGGAGNDTIDSNAGNDLLDGGIGADTLIGGAGNDTYLVDNTGDVISENASEGVDTVKSSANYTLSDNIENLILTGTASIKGTGNNLNNQITGNAANNILNGGTGADRLIGGDGNDTYVVDSLGDVVTETSTIATQVDTVQSTINYTLGANVENLTLIGTAAINGTGNTLNNTLTGNSGNNILNGGIGADTLNGGAGIDTASYANAAAAVNLNLSNATAGTTGEATGDVLNLIENLLGSNFNDILIGNSTANSLNGGAGADQLTGGTGNDTYVVDNTGDVVSETSTLTTEIDTVESAINYSLGANLENLTLTGTTAINGTGNSLNNTITGNAANNILNGGTGNDTLKGGLGNDTYIVENAADIITEALNAGTDSVQSSINWTLAANVENLTLTGSGAINATGNTLNNTITGNAANNILNGGAGSDSLIGGLGNDTYIVENAGDIITEAVNAGTDSVQSSINWTLAANVENLTLTGSGAINATGNTLNNTITGNAANNILNGGAGNDTLNGGAGSDSLLGGLGNDTYIVENAGDIITEALNAGTDTVQSSINWTLGANVENLTLTGTGAINGTGNTLNNTITGNTANNILNGGAGNDILLGGLGNDTYIVENAGDIITEALNAGTDTIQSSINWTLGANVENLTLTGTGAINGTGNTLNNTITGNGANNILNGGTGSDSLLGGLGNDTYIVENAGGIITEALNAGTDSVQSAISWTLGANVENLTLTGTGAINATGNTLNNSITGNAANNILNGGTGSDSLLGGLGNDTYIVENPPDIITEAVNAGTDTVQSAISWTLGNNLENLTLTGTGAINATGNTLNNSITGNGANNILSGGAGNDTLSGGLGNDTYIVENAGDIITEAVNTGTDSVQSAISWTLGNNLENLTLTGTGAINGTGNTLNNTITGNAANNTLNGGAGNDILLGGMGDDMLVGGFGNDILTGGGGRDRISFNSANQGIDTITDFVIVDDTIDISAAGFGGGLTAGVAITAAQLFSGAGVTTATSANQRFLYNTNTGALLFDADGNGAGSSALQIATLTGHPSITNADIFVTA